MTGKLPTGSVGETRDWFVLLDVIESVAGNYVPCMNDPDLFFQENIGGDFVENQLAAKALCATCPVVKECLAFALKHDEPYGIWGGMTHQERKALKTGS